MPSKTHQDILLMRWALFSVAGIILIVVLYSLGVTPAWAQALKGAMASAPFLLAADAPALSPGMGFLLCIALTLALVYDLILIRGTLRKTARSGRLPSSAGLLYPGAGAVGHLLQRRSVPALRGERGCARHPVAPAVTRPASFRTSSHS